MERYDDNYAKFLEVMGVPSLVISLVSAGQSRFPAKSHFSQKNSRNIKKRFSSFYGSGGRKNTF